MSDPRGDCSQGGVCSQRGHLFPGLGGVSAWGDACSGGDAETPLTATAAGGTHPTGMHSSEFQ